MNILVFFQMFNQTFQMLILDSNEKLYVLFLHITSGEYLGMDREQGKGRKKGDRFGCKEKSALNFKVQIFLEIHISSLKHRCSGHTIHSIFASFNLLVPVIMP